jgi:glucose-1-phosphate cytidylyltransferase
MKLINSQCVILAGGLGSRMHELTTHTPKPLVLANGEPLIRHVMRIYEEQGIRNFVILVGYLSYQFHAYFSRFMSIGAGVTYKNAESRVHTLSGATTEHLSITVVETGLETQTGGRLKLASDFLENEFFLSYGDSFAEVNLNLIENQHMNSQNLVTLTAVKPPSRFGVPIINGGKVVKFKEKTDLNSDWISGGFMLVNKILLDYIDSKSSSLEIDVLPLLANEGLVGAHKHIGDFFAVDSVRDLRNFEEYLRNNTKPK